MGRCDGDSLFTFAVGRVRDVSVAEDVVQETFLAALKARARFAGQCSAWSVQGFASIGNLRGRSCFVRARNTSREADAVPRTKGHHTRDAFVRGLIHELLRHY